MVPFGVPNRIRHLICRVSKKNLTTTLLLIDTNHSQHTLAYSCAYVRKLYYMLIFLAHTHT